MKIDKRDAMGQEIRSRAETNTKDKGESDCWIDCRDFNDLRVSHSAMSDCL